MVYCAVLCGCDCNIQCAYSLVGGGYYTCLYVHGLCSMNVHNIVVQCVVYLCMVLYTNGLWCGVCCGVVFNV